MDDKERCLNQSEEVDVTEVPNESVPKRQKVEEINEQREDKKHPKQKVILLFGYLGAGYQGLQR